MANSPSGLNSNPQYAIQTDILRDTKTLGILPQSSILINDQVAKTGQFYAITAINEGCTFDFTDGGTDKCIVSNTTSHIDYDADFKIPSGTTILVDWTKLRLVNGACIAYKR